MTGVLGDELSTAVRAVPGVPDHHVYTRGPKRGDALIGVPVLNEGNRIRAQLRSMGGMGLAEHGADLAIADGGSTDGALDADVLAAGGVRTVLVKEGQGGLSAQLRMLFHWAIEQGYEYLVTVDGNGKDELDGVLRVLEALRAGHDFVQGSRYVPGGVARNTPLARHLGVKLVHAPLISLGARHRYTDTTNGLRGWRTAALADPRVAPLRDVFDRYALHYYLSVRLPRLGYRVCEVPVTRSYPRGDQFPTKITGWRRKAAIIAEVGRAAMGGYDPR